MSNQRHQIYGGKEADEYRQGSQILEDRLRENEIAEGATVEKIRTLMSKFYKDPNQANKQNLDQYIKSLEGLGHSRSRVESMLVRAGANLTIPNPKLITRQPSARALRRQARKGNT